MADYRKAFTCIRGDMVQLCAKFRTEPKTPIFVTRGNVIATN